jgi:hypothetical protein
VVVAKQFTRWSHIGSQDLNELLKLFWPLATLEIHHLLLFPSTGQIVAVKTEMSGFGFVFFAFGNT